MCLVQLQLVGGPKVGGGLSFVVRDKRLGGIFDHFSQR
jgi:hypothetical protein